MSKAYRTFLDTIQHNCNIPYDIFDGEEKVRILHPSGFQGETEIIKFFDSWFKENEILSSCIMENSKIRLSEIASLELVMSADEFVEMKSQFPPVDGYLQPRELRIHLNLVQNSVGKAVDTKYPSDFPIGWVTDLFVPKKVQLFSLHYYSSNTTAGNLGALLQKMLSLLEIDLSS
ncbi:hypothetical protein CANMA_000767 [Candida margitis]|uniref:uncharacterized protein n=1 Tax=Candida margitis TaxID=1775924 RepID=UPI0022268F64|nr:uncharacterized protein CANMA_000767 [Candida margitis]KAI5970156.1 hypothetical protein CANMA_000767 [Candida margitis]